jgi:hypothetical protein
MHVELIQILKAQSYGLQMSLKAEFALPMG